MRKKRLVWNTIFSLLNHIVTIICGFIVSRLILQVYGSSVNGLLSSITQFLAAIAFLEMGVGSVVQSALYTPLAKNDTEGISEIVQSANHFFQKLAYIMVGYVSVLVVVYPFLVKDEFDPLFVISLLLVMSVNYFAQYYFGIVNQLLLNSAQQGYVSQIVQGGTLILNTVVCSVLILTGSSIVIVKFITALIFLLRPIIQFLYVKKQYKINYEIKISGEPIKQKWNGLAQHIAAVVLDNTDTIVLTTLSTLSNVSVYAIYHLVIYGVKNLFLSLTNGINSLLGDMIAKKETKKLLETFGWVEWVLHSGVVILFGCVGVLVVPFVQVYTLGVKDANYIVPTFAVLITLAHAGHCLRLPYNIIVLAGGHYKQTQSCYIVAAILNIVISVATVKLWGLIGVAIGTLAAMIYQTLWLAFYDSKNIIYWSLKNVIRQFGIDFICVVPSICICSQIHLAAVTYSAWMILAVKVALVWCLVFFVVNMVFCRDKMYACLNKITYILNR